MLNGFNSLFNPERDAFRDLQDARLRAAQTNKNILVELGADWCVWCHRLESFIASHPELYLIRSQNFIHVRVHSGSEDAFSEVCKHLPPFEEVPHYFVFDQHGQLLRSQVTADLEEGDSYSYDKVWEFLSLWGSTGSKELL